MLWLDPRECLAAQDALQQGNPAEAVRLLLSSNNPQHRMVRKLLSEAGQRLVEQARRQFEAAELEAASACLNLAAQCLPLEGEAQALRRKVSEALDQQLQHEAWAARQLKRARQLADEGRLHTALDVLAPMAALPNAAPLRLEVEQRLREFRRHVAACQQALQADRAEAAHRHWQRAQAISPESPELVELAQKIARALSIAGGAVERVVAVEDRAQRMMLDSLALVVSVAEVVLGTERGEGVHVPLYDQLHGRHAVFLRDRHGWQLVPCRNRHGTMCPVWVNGEIAAGACRLADDCLIRLGNGNCVWRFRLPVR
uniref:FHA domain-containing protein n=1 Tax=Schlesneria paludicola TaxID=360056 RepID=A0A7C4QPR5_9PLAN